MICTLSPRVLGPVVDATKLDSSFSTSHANTTCNHYAEREGRLWAV